MRLATYRRKGEQALALAFVTPEGRLWDVVDALGSPAGGAIDALVPAPGNVDWLGPVGIELLAEIHRLGPGTLLEDDHIELGPPVPRPGKIIATGRNYMDHLREGQKIWAARGKTVEKAAFPTAFAKFPTAIVASGAPILLPRGVDRVDYEVELAVVIGRPALNVSRDEALGHVAGYTICNDVAARGIQLAEMEHQIGIVRAKNFPTFAPLGPWLVTADEIPDPQALRISLRVNGETRQDANTADMIFGVSELVSYWSALGLETGDIILTGTPAGVAIARPEPADFYLKPGDLVEATIERIGTLVNPVDASPA